MRNISIFALFITMVFGTAAHSAAGDTVDVTLVTQVTSRYIFQDLSIEGSKKPGLVTDIAITKGHWTLDWWQRVDLAGGEYGDRGFGDEHDFTLTGNWSIGSVQLEAAAAYYMLAPLKGVDSDGMQFYLDAGRPFELGHGVSITPAIRLIEFVGFKDFPNFTQVRYRMPIAVSIPKMDGVKVVFDPSFTGAVTGGTKNDFVFRPTESLVWQATSTLSFQLDIKHADRMPTEVDLGLVYHF